MYVCPMICTCKYWLYTYTYIWYVCIYVYIYIYIFCIYTVDSKFVGFILQPQVLSSLRWRFVRANSNDNWLGERLENFWHFDGHVKSKQIRFFWVHLQPYSFRARVAWWVEPPPEKMEQYVHTSSAVPFKHDGQGFACEKHWKTFFPSTPFDVLQFLSEKNTLSKSTSTRDMATLFWLGALLQFNFMSKNFKPHRVEASQIETH